MLNTVNTNVFIDCINKIKSFIKVNLQDKVPSYIRNSETKGFEGGNITKQKWKRYY